MKILQIADLSTHCELVDQLFELFINRFFKIVRKEKKKKAKMFRDKGFSIDENRAFLSNMAIAQCCIEFYMGHKLMSSSLHL